MTSLIPTMGILLPNWILQTTWFAILSTFVAVNTVMYLVLAILKLVPKLYPASWFRRERQRRSETRNIDPNAPV